MLNAKLNQRLTQVNAGTPMGHLLRRYWYPVAASVQLDQEPVLSVRILGEDLALYRDRSGALGLLEEHCPHRGCSLTYGIPESEGLRCAYHGWVWSSEGRCLDQGAEPEETNFRDKVRAKSYPVEELGGLIWAYLGPKPAPLLPRWDGIVREDQHREIQVSLVPCNWLQPMENSMDPVHFEYLHGVYGNYVLGRQGKPIRFVARHHKKVAFDPFEYGIIKRRLTEGASEDDDDWRIGHPVLFPNILAHSMMFQIRVPVDDTNTMHYWYYMRPFKDGESRQDSIPIYDYPPIGADGRCVVDTVNGQDMMAWITQGGVANRAAEHLGTTDQGIIMFRKLLMEQLEKVERGEDPMGVIRDPAKNFPMIELQREHELVHVDHSQGTAKPGVPVGAARGRF